MPTSIVIAGGGLMGLSAAWHLRRADAGVRVTVLERERAGAAASGASAAGVRVMGRDRAERALALASLARWPGLDRELEGATRYRRGGGLRVALDEAAWRAAPGWVAEQRADGVPVEVAGVASTRTLAPGVAASCAGGVTCAMDGQAEAMATVEAFAAAARRLGARVEEGVGAGALVMERGRVVGVTRSDGGREACDVAIVAAGTWSAALLAPLGVRLPLATRALQMLLTEPAPGTLAPVLSAFDRQLSLKQLASGAWLIGGGWPARIPDEAANRWELLEASVQSSRAVAREVYPAVAHAKLACGWAGLEAFTPDGLPVLGPVPGVDAVLVAAGFCGHGFALAPAVGDVLARLALGADARRELWRDLTPARFTRGGA
ncbi:MAG TPA: FAD-binding oxidoreductase [Methylomirabilota bacterium]|nr:FAD-binding oxidoreductase [Methylomirabilota bacterium]